MTCRKDNNLVASDPPPSGAKGLMLMALKTLGRPKDMEKREAILDAAQALFAERGLDGVPIEAIAAASGVSKVTVYGHFGDKLTIFEALAKREADRMAHSFCATDTQGHSLEERLVRFGTELVTMLTQPCHLALDRCMSLEAVRRPEVSKVFFNAGPGRVCALLAKVLDEAAAKGEIAVADTSLAAEDLLSLWLGFPAIRRRLTGCPPSTPEEQQSRIKRGVEMFLRANRPD